MLQVSIGGLGNGGVQSVIMNISKNIPTAEFDVLLFTDETRYYDNEFKKMGGKIFRIPHYNGNNLLRKRLDYYIRFFRIFINVYLILTKNNYDVIHCHNELESGICNLAAYLVGVKIRIAHAHTSEDKFPKKIYIAYIYRTFLKKLMNKTSNIKIGCSEEAFKSLFGKEQLENSNSYIVPNSINLSEFKKTNEKQSDTFNIIHIGRFLDNKNQLFIIELLPYIIEELNQVKLKLIGTGSDYKKLLENKISELKLENYVEFLPSNSNVKEELENSDLCIFPSKNEGFGIVLLEAQAMEVPCLVSDQVPKITDCGLCEFISLSEPKEKWSKTAVRILKRKHTLKLDKNKLEKFDTPRYSSFIKELYLGVKFKNKSAYLNCN